jgi:hypothetical protein
VFRRQHAAPGLADEVVAVGDAEMREQAVELTQKEIDRPEFGALVAQMGGASVPELIVVDDSATGRGEILEGVDIVVRAAGPPCSTTSGALLLPMSPVTLYQVRPNAPST